MKPLRLRVHAWRTNSNRRSTACTGKLGHGVPDKEADDCGEQERKRHVRPGLEGDDRKSEDDVGRRRDVRDALEHQFRETERIASKLRIRIGSDDLG